MLLWRTAAAAAAAALLAVAASAGGALAIQLESYNVTAGERVLVQAYHGAHSNAAFGPTPDFERGPLAFVEPPEMCEPGFTVRRRDDGEEAPVLVAMRGNCSFARKAVLAQEAGAAGLVVANNVESSILVNMAWDDEVPGEANMTIPAVFVFQSTRDELLELDEAIGNGTADYQLLDLILNPQSDPAPEYDAPDLSSVLWIILAMPLAAVMAAVVLTMVRQRRERREAEAVLAARHQASRDIPVVTYNTGLLRSSSVDGDEGGAVPGPDGGAPEAEASTRSASAAESAENPATKLHNDSCPVCFEAFTDGEGIKRLRCSHGFHPACIDPWIDERSDRCPVCRLSIVS